MEPTDVPAITPRPPTAPRPIAWVDGRILPAAEATVPLLDDGFLRGDAVFEAVLVRGGRTYALAPHLARLRRSGDALDLRVPVVRQTVTDLLAAWGEHDGALRLIVTRSGTVRGTLGAVSWPETISLAVVELPWLTALSGIKTLSYAANQLAIRRARAAGADDALIVDGGLVHELPTGSLCVVKDGRVSSPDPARMPILDSVTVRSLAEIVEVRRTAPSLEEVREADELFVVSATRPVLAVDTLVVAEDDHIDFAAPGVVTARLKDAFERHIAAGLDPLP